MSAHATPPVVRYRSSCPDLTTYRERHKIEYVRSGVFIPSDRREARPLGTRVHLKIELADRTLGYSGGAIVVEHVQEGGRLGYVLRLDEVTIEVELDEGAAETPAMTPSPGGAAISAPDPAPAAAVAPAAAASATPAAAAAEGAATTAATSPSSASSTSTPAPRATPRPELLDLLFGEEAPAAAPPAPPAASADPFGAPAAAVASSADPFVAAAGGVPPPAPVTSPITSPGPAPFPAPGPDPLAPIAEEHPAEGAAGAQDGGPAAPPGPADRSEVALLELPRRPLLARLARPRVLLSMTAALAAAALVTVVMQRRAAAIEAAFVEELSAADARVGAGRLAVPAGDAALDHLDAARRLLPDDARLASRGKLLADTFEDLGLRALGRGDLREAAAHFRSALRAEPARASARSQLETIARIEPKRRDGPR